MAVGEQLGRRLNCLGSGVTKEEVVVVVEEEEKVELEQIFSFVYRHSPTHGNFNFRKVRHRS